MTALELAVAGLLYNFEARTKPDLCRRSCFWGRKSSYSRLQVFHNDAGFPKPVVNPRFQPSIQTAFLLPGEETEKVRGVTNPSPRYSNVRFMAFF
jgi:hypothetical protein